MTVHGLSPTYDIRVEDDAEPKSRLRFGFFYQHTLQHSADVEGSYLLGEMLSLAGLY